MERPRFDGGFLRHVLAIDEDGAGRQVFEAGDHAEQRGLAAARGADEDHELAVLDVEAGARNDDDIAKGLACVLERDRAHFISPLRM